jgi:hypothetical protein
MDDQYKVLLPARIWKEAKDKQQAKQLIMDYMRHYPHYRLAAVKDGFAICYRKQG